MVVYLVPIKISFRIADKTINNEVSFHVVHILFLENTMEKKPFKIEMYAFSVMIRLGEKNFRSASHE